MPAVKQTRRFMVWIGGPEAERQQFEVWAHEFRVWWQGEGAKDGRYLFFYDGPEPGVPRADEFHPFNEPVGRPRVVAVVPPGWTLVEDITDNFPGAGVVAGDAPARLA